MFSFFIAMLSNFGLNRLTTQVSKSAEFAREAVDIGNNYGNSHNNSASASRINSGWENVAENLNKRISGLQSRATVIY